MLKLLRWLMAIVCLAALSVTAAGATEHVVKMRNNNGKGKFMLFEPDVVKAAPGDTVRFVPVDKGHNAVTLPEVWPEGVPALEGELNEEVVLTLEKPGIYGIKCLPHYPMGMIAMIVAGEKVNAAQLEKLELSGGAQKRLDALRAEIAAP